LGKVNQPRDRFGRLGGQFQRVKVKNGGRVQISCRNGQNALITIEPGILANSEPAGGFAAASWNNFCQPSKRSNQPRSIDSKIHVHRSALQQKGKGKPDNAPGSTVAAAASAAAGNGRTVQQAAIESDCHWSQARLIFSQSDSSRGSGSRPKTFRKAAIISSLASQ
jgi:hypothetical protein